MDAFRTRASSRAPARRRSTTAPSRRRAQIRRRRAVLVLVTLLGLGAGLVVAFSDKVNRAIEEVTLPLRHEDIIRQQARRRDIDPALIAALIYAESRFHDQTSHAGARGLMQITPGTAKAIERLSGGTTFVPDDLADPDINIRYGTFYLKLLLDHYRGNEVAALAAYNAGQTNVDAWGGADLGLDDIRFRETRGYVDQVLDKQSDYRNHYSRELGLR
jgi:soluble lytic murein transglycosylase